MPNRLTNETSPYLLQHASNPVQWYPWGEEALALARSQNKPILLSIGYSACHWCHVMAHESFEDTEVAAAMNRDFINIKVDREERPDLDHIYQAAHYLLNRRNGGWPLTLFLTPQQQPFFGGTYFSKLPRYGLPGFLDLLPRVAEAYHTRGQDISRQTTVLLKALADELPAGKSAVALPEELFRQAATKLGKLFDTVNGGLGSPPKFIHPAELAFCLRRYAETGDKTIQHIPILTLQKMAEGGIYDQLGGGFCRYSTDSQWCVPHFEKMLYDNGSLLQLYTDAWLSVGYPLFKEVVERTAEWVIREMQAPAGGMVPGHQGGYYAALDADSEKEEGKFYVWDREEIRQALTVAEYTVIACCYGLDRSPNFEGRYWHLQMTGSIDDAARDLCISPAEAEKNLNVARQKLFVIRQLRTRPGCDEKILAGWNGLMIKGMARAGHIFGCDRWIDSASAAAGFIRMVMWQNNQLKATYKDGSARYNACLDDYAFLLDGLLELMQARYRQADMDFAIALADALLEKFEDREAGGFFFTGHDHETLIHRPKPGYDHATPSGNGMAASALQQLGYLLGEPRYLQAAARTLEVFSETITRQPGSCCTLLGALQQSVTSPQVIILRGSQPTLGEWQGIVRQNAPSALIFALSSELVGLPAGLNKHIPADRPVSAWVCKGARCLPEISDLQELRQACKVPG
jgi:uncharacterized protein